MEWERIACLLVYGAQRIAYWVQQDVETIHTALKSIHFLVTNRKVVNQAHLVTFYLCIHSSGSSMPFPRFCTILRPARQCRCRVGSWSWESIGARQGAGWPVEPTTSDNPKGRD